MGKLHRIGSVTIRIWPNDHLPPHFHAIGPGFEALIEIETLSIREGALAPAIRRAVLEWAAGHKDEIAAEWTRTNPRFPVA